MQAEHGYIRLCSHLLILILGADGAGRVFNNNQIVCVLKALQALMVQRIAEKRYRNLVYLFIGASGNAATWLESLAVTGGTYAYGGYPDIDGLFSEQAVELDRAKREQILYKVQQLIYERAMFAPVWDFAFLHGIGPRVEESGLGLLEPWGFSGPYEDVKLKGK